VFIGDFYALTGRQRIFCAAQLAEGDEPESNILHFVEKLMAGQDLGPALFDVRETMAYMLRSHVRSAIAPFAHRGMHRGAEETVLIRCHQVRATIKTKSASINRNIRTKSAYAVAEPREALAWAI
jgi:hypothetical protein